MFLKSAHEGVRRTESYHTHPHKVGTVEELPLTMVLFAHAAGWDTDWVCEPTKSNSVRGAEQGVSEAYRAEVARYNDLDLELYGLVQDTLRRQEEVAKGVGVRGGMLVDCQG